MKTITDISIATIKLNDLWKLSNDYSFLSTLRDNFSPLNHEKLHLLNKILPDSIINYETEASLGKIEDNEPFVNLINELMESNEIDLLNFEKDELIGLIPEINDLQLSQIAEINDKDDEGFIEEADYDELFKDSFSNCVNNSDASNCNDAILDICSDDTIEDVSVSIFVKQKFSKTYKFFQFFQNFCSKDFVLSLRQHKKSIKTTICFVISVYNIVFIPIMLVHHSDFGDSLPALELVISLCLSLFFSQKFAKYWLTYRKMSLNNKVWPQLKHSDENALILKLKSTSYIILTFLLEFLYIIPFHLIYIYDPSINQFLIILTFIRVCYVTPLIKGVSLLKQKNSLIGNIVHILLLYILFAHVSACVLIFMAFSEQDFNDTFLRRIPAPEYSFINVRREKFDVEFETVYIHALYWVYSTISKDGAIDITVVNLKEKIFAIGEMIFGGLLYIYIFGNVISIAEDLTPKVKTLLGKNKKIVMNMMKYLKFDEYAYIIEVFIMLKIFFFFFFFGGGGIISWGGGGGGSTIFFFIFIRRN